MKAELDKKSDRQGVAAELSPQAIQDCIAAFATPPGQSALAVLRISGPVAAQVVDCLFKPGPGFKSASELAGYTMSYGYWYDRAGLALDEVVIAAFREPHSYTGENLIEISCHGGYAARQALLDSLLALGVSPAGPGEFSRRAFLNGKLDLSQAEAVMDLISALSKNQGKLALTQRRGAIKEAVADLSNSLYQALAQIEMILEFSDQEGLKPKQNLERILAELEAKMAAVLAGYRQGRIIREGFKVVLAGQTNAGKSSLLNRLMGEERAIVTDISGTTRDRLDGFIDLDGIPVQLTDTAGFRHSDDPVEAEGIRRAGQALAEADLILRVLNPDFSPDQFATEFAAIDAHLDEGQDLVIVLGKSDLTWPETLLEQIDNRYPDLSKLTYSQLEQESLDELRALIISKYQALGPAKQSDVLLSNSRQKQCLERSSELLNQAKVTLAQGLPLELTAACLRSAIDQLAEITGENVSEELIEQIFSRFCVGK